MSADKFRYRLKFSKTGMMRFIGHLDLMRIFQRAVKRAGLPIAYSQGFNPHQLMSFALPLPLGMESYGEYAELEFTERLDMKNDRETLLNALNSEFPTGLQVTATRICSKNEKSAAAQTEAAAYEIIFEESIKNSGVSTLQAIIPALISETLYRTEIIVQKKTKSATNKVNIRPDIYGLTCETEPGIVIVKALLSAGSKNYLKPQVLIDWMLSMPGFGNENTTTSSSGQVDNYFGYIEYKRIDLFTNDKQAFKPLIIG